MRKEQGSLNYVKMEKQILSFWKENNTFNKLKEQNKQYSRL